MNPAKNHIMEQKIVFRTGGIASILQLAIIAVIMVAVPMAGKRPEAAEEFFRLYNDNTFQAILCDDFSSLFIIFMYLFTFPAIYLILKESYPLFSAFTLIFTLIAVTLCFATHSGFSFIHLSEQYANATNDLDKYRILAAGEAVLAGDMWHSSAGFISGILLQGAGVIFSLLMLKAGSFSKITAYSGLIGNGFDLIQHLLHYSIPEISTYAMMLAGPAYAVWFVVLARDLFKYSGKVYENTRNP